MEAMVERLSSLENLYFPRAIQDSAITPTQRKALLLDLLSRDTVVFLERYGSRQFDALKGDYEVDWHLSRLWSLLRLTSEEVRSCSVTVKNRRRACLDRLVSDRSYFSEDAMREREPFLHHEYVGRFQDPSGRSMVRPGERWSETLIRRCEDSDLVEKIRAEQQRMGVAQRDCVGNVAEEEDEKDEEEDEAAEKGKEEACHSEDSGPVACCETCNHVPSREHPILLNCGHLDLTDGDPCILICRYPEA